MKSILITIITFFCAASYSCPVEIELVLQNYAFDGAYENSGFNYRASTVDLLKGHLNEISVALAPDEVYFDPELQDYGGCAYYSGDTTTTTKTDYHATFWPNEDISLTIIHESYGEDGTTSGHYINAHISPDRSVFYDVTYGDTMTSDPYEHNFAEIVDVTQKLRFE